ESEQFAEADSKKRELIETINNCDNAAADIEKNLEQFSSQIDQAEATKVKDLLTQLKSLTKTSENPEELKTKLHELNQASMNLFQMVYQKKMNQQQQSNPSEPQEADFKDVKN